MGKLSLQEAFAVFGGKPANRLHSLSALAGDGTALILSCYAKRFTHPKRGVLRYHDTLTTESGHPAEMQSLGRLLSTRHKEVQLAGRGRLLIPEGFREFLQVPSGGDVMVVGAAICIEIWNPPAWRTHLETQLPAFQQLFDQLAG